MESTVTKKIILKGYALRCTECGFNCVMTTEGMYNQTIMTICPKCKKQRLTSSGLGEFVVSIYMATYLDQEA